MIKKKICKIIANSKIFKKWSKYIDKKQNEKFDNYCFLQELCVEKDSYGKTLNLNKYYRLLNMIKRKYK